MQYTNRVDVLFYLVILSMVLLGITLICKREKMEIRLSMRKRVVNTNMVSMKVKKFLMKGHYSRKYDREIYDAISFLRNVLVNTEDMSVEDILSVLIEYGGKLKKVYQKSLSYYRLNKPTEMIEYFCSTVNTRSGEDFIRLIQRWDSLDGNTMSHTLFSYQKAIKEARKTSKKRFDETVSDILYIPIIINVMLVFIDFIYVGYFSTQKEMFSQLFG